MVPGFEREKAVARSHWTKGDELVFRTESRARIYNSIVLEAMERRDKC